MFPQTIYVWGTYRQMSHKRVHINVCAFHKLNVIFLSLTLIGADEYLIRDIQKR